MQVRAQRDRLARTLGVAPETLERFVDLHPEPTPAVVLRSGEVSAAPGDVDADTRARLGAYIDRRTDRPWVLPEDLLEHVRQHGPVTRAELIDAFRDDVHSPDALRWYARAALESDDVEAVGGSDAWETVEYAAVAADGSGES